MLCPICVQVESAVTTSTPLNTVFNGVKKVFDSDEDKNAVEEKLQETPISTFKEEKETVQLVSKVLLLTSSQTILLCYSM